MASKKDSKGKATNWVKNFGKSVQFSAVDILGELAPATKDTAESASSVLQDVVKDLRGLKIGQNQLIRELNTIPAFKYSKEAFQNAKSDIKSGKLNNQDRLQKMVDADMGDFDDEDFDFSTDDSEMSFEPGAEDEFSTSESTEFNTDVTDAATAAAKPIAETLRPGINATAISTHHTAIASEQFASGQVKQTKAMVSGFETTNKSNSQIAAMQFTMTNKFHEENVAIFNNMNTNIEKLVRFNDETMSKQAMGSLKFFEDQLTATNNILAEIQKIREAVAPEKPEPDELEKSQYSQLFKGNGVMKFGNYGAILKQNFLAAADSDPFLSMIKEFVTNEEALKSLAANPLGFVTSKLVSNILPNIVKTTLRELDKSIAGFFPALFAKINAQMDSDNPIKSLLGKIFGLQTDVRTAPDFSQYEKGAVPFDGVTRTAITSVIPNYLAGILAALTGSEEQTFDYEKGTFTTKYAMMKEMNEDEENRLTSGYGKLMSEMQKNLESFIYESDKDRKETMDGLKDFLINVTLNQKLPDINKVETFGGGDVGRRLKAAFKAMNRSTQIGLSNGMFKSMESQNDFINMIERERPDLLAKYQSIRGGFMSNLHGSRDENGAFKIEKGDNPFVQTDKYGFSQLDYLHDIKQALVDGIIVYPSGTNNANPNGPGGGPGIDPEILKRKTELAAKNKDVEELEEQRENDKNDAGKPDQEEREEQEKRGKISKTMMNAASSGDDTSTLEAMIRANRSAKGSETTDRSMGGIWEWLNKTLNGRTFGENIDKIKQSIGKFLKMPVDFFVNAAEHVDKTLYTIIYGDEDSGESILTVTINNIKNSFNKVNNWIRSKFDDFGAWLFDGDFAGTQMYKWVKGKANDIFDYMFGKKTGEDGHRSGGALSESFNALKDFGLSVRSELFGTAYKDSSGKEHAQNTNSVFHNIKNGVSDALNAMKVYLFGPEKVGKDGKKKSFMDSIADSLGEGFANWKNFFFGEKLSTEQGQAQMKEAMEGFKKAMPKAMAVGIVGAGVGMLNMFGGFGLLGSVFLPGGPIGGAILGTGLGLLGQSEKFKKFLFGEKGVDGKRMGGIISRGVMDWVTKHKVALLGGATFGATKGLIGAFMPAIGGPIGFMGSFLLPGGPITGALMGAAVGIAWKSKTFQEFLYGKDDGSGKKMGGILNNKMGSSMKKHLPNMAIGAIGFGGAAALIGQLGFMGAMLTPMGPIGAAIMGAATGIGISSEKFKNFLFGKKDDQTGIREGGLFGQVKNFFTIQLAAPFTTWMQTTSENIRHWFVDKISIPFKASLKPFQTAMSLFVKDIQNMFKSGWKYLMSTLDGIFERAVGLPMAKFVAEKVVNPMKKFMNTLINGIGKAFGFILSSTVKAMHFMAMSLAKGQQKRGQQEVRDEKLENLKSAGGGIVDWFMGRGKKGLFDTVKDAFIAAKDYGTAVATGEGKDKYINLDEIKEEEERLRAEEKAKHEEKMNKFNQKIEENRKRAELANKANYHNVFKDKNGKSYDLRALYNMEVPLNDIDLAMDESNGWLQKIANLSAALLAHVSGNTKAQDYAASDSTGKAGAPSIPPELKPTSKDEKVMDSKKKHDEHIAENQEDDDNKDDKRRKILDRMADRRRKEMEHNAGLAPDVINLGPAPEKETPGAPAADQTASDNGDGTSTPKKGGKRFSLHNLLGRGFKFKFSSDEDISKFIDMLPGQESMDPEAYAKMQARLDRLMNRYLSRDQKDKKQTQEVAQQVQAAGGVAPNQGTGAPVTGPINKQTVAAQQKKARAEENAAGTVETSEDRKFDSKNGIGKGGGVNKAIKYLRIIASNVDGQLNGVGSNVYKTRKILESLTGISGDTVGSGNRDRTTFMGRFGRIFKMMIFNPVAFIGEMISKPIEIITDLGKKVYDTIWNVVDGIGSMITKTGELLFDAGKTVVETIAAVPKMAVDIVKGASEVLAETAKAGIRAIGEGLVGLTKATFTIVTSAGEALGSILSGLGTATKDVFIGLGKVSKEVMVGIGKGVKAAVDVAGEVAKSTVKIGTAMTEAVTKVASEGIVQVGRLATNLITSVGNLITSATGTLFSIAASPFKFLGKLGGNLVQRSSHVIVDGGSLKTIDQVKVVDLVRLVERIGGSPMPDLTGQGLPGGAEKKAKNAGDNEKPEEPGTPSADQETKEEKESKEEKKKREGAVAEGKEEAKPKKETEDKKKEEKPGKPAASNVTADMKKSGLAPAEGNMQRTAANTKAIAEVNAEKKLMQDMESSQTKSLTTLVDQGKERSSFWKKFWKWLMAAIMGLASLIKGIIKRIPGLPALASALAGGAKKFGERVEKTFVVKWLKSKVPAALEKLGSKMVELLTKIKQKLFGELGEDAAEKAAGKAAKDAAEGSAEKGAEAAAKKKLPQLAAGKGAAKAGEEAGEVATEQGVKALGSSSARTYSPEFAEAYKGATEQLGRELTPQELEMAKWGFQQQGMQVYAEAGEQAGKVAAEQTAEKAAGEAAESAAGSLADDATRVTTDVPATDLGSEAIPKYKSAIIGAIETLENCANAVAKKLGIKAQISFAKPFEKLIFEKLTDTIIGRFASRFAAATAKMALSTTPAALVTNAIFVSFGAVAGYNDAAHLFAVNKDAVTATMRLCAVLVKAISNVQLIPIIILDVVAVVIGAVGGFDPYAWMARGLYSLLTDDKAAQELEAAQLKFKQEAADAGYVNQETGEVDVDAYNDEVNKTLGDKISDAWSGAKNWIGESWRNTFGYTDENGEEHRGWVEKGWDNNMAWLFGQNDENGNYQNGLFANMKEGIDNNLAYAFGQNGEPSQMMADIKDYLYDKFTNTIDWFFGVEPGATDNLMTKINDKIDNELAWLFGQNDENGNYQGGVFANAKKDLNKRIENNIVYLFGGTDPYTGDERRGKIGELYDDWVKPWWDPLKANILDPLAQGIQQMGENIQSGIETMKRMWNSLVTKVSGLKKEYLDPVLVGIFGESDYFRTDENGNLVPVQGKKSFVGEFIDKLKTRFFNWINEGVYSFRKSWHDLAVWIFGNEFVGPIQDPRDLGAVGDNDSYQIATGNENITNITQDSGFSGGGIGDEQYLQTNYKGVKYGNEPGMGDVAAAGCLPSVVAKVENENTGSDLTPVDVARVAEATGDRVPGGTSEAFMDKIGGSPIGSSSDAIAELQNGNKVIIGGRGTSYISSATDAGHYMELEGVNGNKAQVFDPLEGHREVSLDSLARQTETAYSFSGGGIADDIIEELRLPDLSQADTSAGIIPGYIDAFAKWFVDPTTGILGAGVRLFQRGWNAIKNWVFGGLDDVDPNYLYNLITKKVPAIFEEWFKTLKTGLQEKWDTVKDWLFSDSNLSKDSILDTFKNGLKWAADKLQGKGGTGDNIARIQQHRKFYGGGATRIPKKKFKFTGGGNTMYMPQQSASDNCTLTAAAALINAYTGSQTTSDDYSFGNWYKNVMGMPSSEEAFQPPDKASFDSTVESHFNAHPEWPVFLYQTGGAGSSSGHPLNRGSGNHATIIGRKLGNGSYEIYDSNGGRQVQLSLDQIFDPTAEGSSRQNTVGQGNLLLIPNQAPSQPITEWGSDSGSSGASSAQASASGGAQQEEQKGLLETMTGALSDVFESVKVGASGKVWSPAAKISNNGNHAPSGAMGPASGKGAENIPSWSPQHYIDLAVRASNLSGIPADWIWAQWNNEAGRDFDSPLARENHNLAGLTVPTSMPHTTSGGMNWGLWDSDEDFADYWGGTYIKLFTGATSAKNMYEYVDRIQNQPDGQNYCADPPGTEAYYNNMLSRLGNQGTVVGAGLGDFFGAGGIEKIRQILLARRLRQVQEMKKNGGRIRIPRVPSEQRKNPGSDMTDKANIQYDDLGNITGLEIPDYNRITSEDSKAVIDAKKAAQQKLLQKSGFLGNGLGADILRKILMPTGIFGHITLPEGSVLQPKAPTQNEPVEPEVAPNGLHYTTNDVEYLIKKGYTREDALAFLATDPKYTTDVGLGTKNSGSVATQQQERPQYWWERDHWGHEITASTSSSPKNTNEATEVAPNGRHYLQNDIDYLVKQGYTREEAIAVLSTDPKYTQPYTETPGTTSTNQRVSNRLPSQHEPVEPEVAPNGLHYTTNDVNHLMQTGKVSREEALKILSTQSKYTDPITADDMKYVKPDRSKGKRKHGGILGLIGGWFGLNKVGYKMKDIREENPWMNVKSETMAPEIAPNGTHYSENDINHLLNAGYSRENAIAALSKDPKYTNKSEYTSRGTYTFKPEDEKKDYYYGGGIADELLARRARQVEELRRRNGRPLYAPETNRPEPKKYTFSVPSLLPEPTYTKPTLSELATMAPQKAEEHTPSLLETLNAMRAKHGKEALLVGKDVEFKGSELLDNNLKTPTVVGDITQADITSFTGGEYFNDVNKVAPEAKAYVRGEGDLFAVAKAIGFNGLPSEDTPLTAGMQQALGFREYNPIRTWGHYLTASQMWKRRGMTSVESWMQFHGGGFADELLARRARQVEELRRRNGRPLYTPGINLPETNHPESKKYTFSVPSLLPESPYTKPTLSELAAAAPQKVEEHTPSLLETLNAMRAKHGKEALLVGKDVEFKGSKLLDNNLKTPTVVGDITQADITSFTGGEYFNDVNKVAPEAKAYVRGEGDLFAVAKAIGFNGLPSEDTPLTAGMQQALGFREYSPIRTWGHYLTASQMWKRRGMTSVESWVQFHGGGFADELLARRAHQVEELRRRNGRPLYAPETNRPEPKKYTFSVPSLLPEPTYTKPTLSELATMAPQKAEEHTPSLLETLNAMRAKHGKKALLVGKDVEFKGSKLLDNNLKTPTVVGDITQSGIDTFTGGEYFNDVNKVAPEAKAYVRGEGDLFAVAKAIGFNGLPSEDTPLTAGMQQALGFREYSPIRTWGHYLTASQMWKRRGMTSVESWMQFHGGGFVGSGLNIGNILRGVITTVGMYNAMRRRQGPFGVYTPTGIAGPINRNGQVLTAQQNEPLTNVKAPNGLYYTKNDVDYLLSQGYSWDDAIAFLATDPKYTTPIANGTIGKTEATSTQQKPGSVATTARPKFNQHEPVEPEVAPNGLHYTTNDVNHLMQTGKVSREEALKILSTQSKYTDPVTEADLKYVKPDRSKGKRKHGGLFGWIGGMLGINKVGYKMKDIREANDWMNVKSETMAPEVAPNGAHYSENDINHLLNAGYSREDAIAVLSKDPKYTNKSEYTSRGTYTFKPEDEKKDYYYGGGFTGAGLNIGNILRGVITTVGAYGAMRRRQGPFGVYTPTGIAGPINRSGQVLTAQQNEPLTNVKAPNGLYYTKNDMDYLLNQGYSWDDAIAFLATDPKYTTPIANGTIGKTGTTSTQQKPGSVVTKARPKFNQHEPVEPEVAPNGLNYTTNDLKYVMENYKVSREEALKILSRQSKYTDPVTAEDLKYVKPDRSKGKRKHGGLFGWIGGMLGVNKVGYKMKDIREKNPWMNVKSETVAGEVAKNGAHFTENDINYLISQGYTRDDAIKFLSQDKKYTEKVNYTARGVHTFKPEDQKKPYYYGGGFAGAGKTKPSFVGGFLPAGALAAELLGAAAMRLVTSPAGARITSFIYDNWGRIAAAIEIGDTVADVIDLVTDMYNSEVGGGIGDNFKGAGRVHQKKPYYYGGGTAEPPSLLETLNAMRKKHGKEALVMGADTRYVGSKQALKNLQTPTVFNGITQADITSFTGGEYFNAEDKITPEAKAYARGEGDLWEVAKSIGFNGLPTEDTPLTANMQQMLGFREYSPVRTWAHYLTASELWRRGGMTSAERWIHAVAPKPAPSDEVGAPTVADTLNEGQTEVGKALEDLKKIEERRSSSNSDDLLSKMVDILTSIATNTGSVSDGIKNMGQQRPSVIMTNQSSPNAAVPLILQNMDRDRMNKDVIDALSNPKANDELTKQIEISKGGEFVR